MELFERISYYGQAVVISVFFRDYIGFSAVEAGQLDSIFNGLIWFLPILAGALVDHYGIRKCFVFGFSVLAAGYFLLASFGMSLHHGILTGQHKFSSVALILIFTAIGGAFIKPSVLGTITLFTDRENRSSGFAIYYWVTNLGGLIGPLIAYFMRGAIGVQAVYLVSAGCCALMLISCFFYEEKHLARTEDINISRVFHNLVRIIRDWKFMQFLSTYSIFWITSWQMFVIIPFYLRDHVSKDAPFSLILSVVPLTVILFQAIVTRLTRKLSMNLAMLTGLGIGSLCWLIILLRLGEPYLSMETIIAIGFFVGAIGSMVQAPRYYERIGSLAPEGQVAFFQGFALLPVAVGWFLGGTLGGWAYHLFSEVWEKPDLVFLAVFLVNVLATFLMAAYGVINKSGPTASSA